MSTSRFDAGLRAVFPDREVGRGLESKVDVALARFNRKRAVRRRVQWSLVATAAAVLGVWSVPVVQAQATLSRIAGALDGVKTVVATRFSVAEDGARFPAGVIAYDRGRWRLNDGSGGRLNYYLDGKSYTFDKTLEAFVVTDRPDGPFAHNSGSLRISDLLTASEGNRWTRRVTTDDAVLDGRQVKRVTVENGDMPEKSEFYVDTESDLPIEVRGLSKEGGSWRLREIMSFQYDQSIDPATFRPDLKRYPAVSEKEADRRFETAMTRHVVAEMPLKKGRFVVRSLDVAEDGTVYAVFQAGERHRNSWFGFALDLKADDGTTYVRRETVGFADDNGSLPKEGKFEVETFVPLEPRRPWRPVSLTLSVAKFRDGSLARIPTVMTEYPSGAQATLVPPHPTYVNGEQPKTVQLPTQKIDRPTCAVRPEILVRIDYSSFNNEIVTDILKAGVRADRWMAEKRWAEALTWLNETARLMRLHERLGYGGWRMDRVLHEIDYAEKQLAQKRP